ncbi:MAG: response regulator [Gammaproteobacteria bacterium]
MTQIKVLLIDDSSDDNFFHERAIKKSGLDAAITVFTHAEGALEYLQSIAENDHYHLIPHLILLDINMPRMTGWEFLDVYASLPGSVRKSVVIVMLSTSPDPRDKSLAEDNELVADFSNKPLTADSFRAMIKQHLDRRED